MLPSFIRAGFCVGLFIFAAAAQPASAQADAEAGGFLYQVERQTASGSQKMYLYGTLHVGTADRPFSAAMQKALGTSQRVALEVDPGDVAGIAQGVAKYAVYPAGDSLDRHLSPELWQRVQKRAALYQLDAAQAMRLKPWMLADTLVVLETVRLGLNPGYGSENRLVLYAGAHSLPIVEIEGADSQLRMLDGFPAAMQIEMLVQTLDDLDSGKAQRELGETVAAWQNGDVAGIEGQLRRMREEEGEAGKAFVERLLDTRNKFMADQAVTYISQPGTTFFAVGALHLFGENGLIRELGQRGFSVEPVR